MAQMQEAFAMTATLKRSPVNSHPETVTHNLELQELSKLVLKLR